MDGHGIMCNERTVKNLKDYANLLCSFLHQYSFLTEAYVLDYFVDSHWTKLPASWQIVFSDVEPQELGKFLNKEEPIRFKEVCPLSLQAFRACAFALALSRKASLSLDSYWQFLEQTFSVQSKHKGFDDWKPPEEEFRNKSGQHKALMEAFRRHVKPKKQHEIVRLSQVADMVFQSLNLNHILDIGAGQGHLSRLLCFHHGFKVATIEAEHDHVSGAENFDKQAIAALLKNKKTKTDGVMDPFQLMEYELPKHIEGFLSLKSSNDFLEQISRKAWPTESELNFGLLGLHTCGNLAATLLHLFTNSNQARALLSVGCCYMKLDTEGDTKGYPLSKHVSQIPQSNLSYEAREVACHALEMYIKRLYENAASLKIHCYRAALEKLIVRNHPNMKHIGLRGVKHAEKMHFNEYAMKALKDKTLYIPEDEFLSEEMDRCLQEWKKVIIFYSLRLLIAPVVESLILLDRMLYLYENGCPNCIIPLFDPAISPRNHVLIAAKK